MWNGVISRAELQQAGLNGHRIAELKASGKLVHVSRGWYAQRDANPMVALAAAGHAQLGCLSACERHGLWVPSEPEPRIHLVVNNSDSISRIANRLHDATKGQVRPIVHRGVVSKNELVADVCRAVEHVARFHSVEQALIVIESALNLGKLSVPEVEHLLEMIPKSRARYLWNFQPNSQSGSETRVAHFLRNRGFTVVQQFSPVPNWYTDMKVGSSWIIECDSVAHHGSPDDFARDRQRDLLLAEMGYEVTRLSYRQIWDDWASTRRVLIRIANRRRYRKEPEFSWREI